MCERHRVMEGELRRGRGRENSEGGEEGRTQKGEREGREREKQKVLILLKRVHQFLKLVLHGRGLVAHILLNAIKRTAQLYCLATADLPAVHHLVLSE